MSGGFALHLLRHGEVEGAGLLLGQTDPAPLPQGLSLCGARAQGLAIDGVVTSDLARARLAAEAIARERDLPCRSDTRWREMHFGDWDGADPAALPRGALAPFYDDPEANPPPGGERWSALRARVGEALREIEQPTLIVTHAGAIRAVLAVLFGFDHRQVWALALPYGALLSLRVEGDFTQITGVVT